MPVTEICMSNYSRFALVGLILVPFVAICFLSFYKKPSGLRTTRTPRKTTLTKKLITTLPHVDYWSYDHKQRFNASAVVSHQMYLVYENYEKQNKKYYPEFFPIAFEAPTPVVQNITASKLWTAEYFANQNITMRVRKQRQKQFLNFDFSKPIQEDPTYAVVTLSSKDFFENLEKEQADYFYYSNIIEAFSEAAANEFVPFTKDLEVTAKSKSSNIWFGGRSSSIRTHYDALHNMYIQIRGQKKFTLYPPSWWRFLYLYPRLHACHRTSQVDPTSVDKKLFPQFQTEEKGPQQITLHEGDILYIPPYWFHEAESIGVSISANIWTESFENDAFENLMRAPLPFEDSWSKEKKIFAARHYVATCITKYIEKASKDTDQSQQLYHYKGVKDYIEKVLRIRYEPLIAQGVLSADVDIDNFCLYNRQEAVISDAFDKATEGVAELAVTLSPSIRDIIMGNYFEEVLAVALEAKHIGAFLKYCFK